MEKSQSIKSIAAALQAFQGKMSKIKKDSNNPFFKSKYASLSTILEHIQEPLAECGISFAQFPDGTSLCTIIMHGDSGEWMQANYDICPVKNDPQAIGSAITYARRYALGAVLGLNIDDDDDANAATGKTESKPQQQVSTEPNGTTAVELPWLNENTEQYTKAVTWLKASPDNNINRLRELYKISKSVGVALNKDAGR